MFWLPIVSSLVSGVLLLLVGNALRAVASNKKELQEHALALVGTRGDLKGHCELDETRFREHERRFKNIEDDVGRLRDWHHEVGNKAQVAVARMWTEREREGKG